MSFGYWNYYNYFNMRFFRGMNLINSFFNTLFDRNYYSPFINFYANIPVIPYMEPRQPVFSYRKISDTVGDLLENSANEISPADISAENQDITIPSYAVSSKVGDLLSNLSKNPQDTSALNYFLPQNNSTNNFFSNSTYFRPQTTSTTHVDVMENSNQTQNLKINSSDSADIKFSGSKVIIGSAIQKRIKQIASKINCDYKDLLGLIYCESSFRTVPKNWNGKSAVGLIQFTNINIKDLNSVYGANLTKEKIAAMSPLEQLDWAEKSLLRAKQIAGFSNSHRLSASELYAINYAPAYAKRKAYVTKKGDGLYEGNSGLDLNKDGKITHDELAQKIKRGSINVVA